ncbi:MAG: CoB--CoM heterodisulfide reductase subunit C [Candidatus Hydrothermarchaeota archaeon]
MPSRSYPSFADEVIEAGGETLNLCYQCGTCTGTCPSGRLTAFRVRNIIKKAQFGFKDDILPNDDLWMCVTCYMCYERCPRRVDIPGIILILRNMSVSAGFMADNHKKAAENLIKTGHSVLLTDKYKEMRKALGLPEEPPTTLTDQEALKEIKVIVGRTGFENLLRRKK